MVVPPPPVIKACLVLTALLRPGLPLALPQAFLFWSGMRLGWAVLIRTVYQLATGYQNQPARICWQESLGFLEEMVS